MLVMYQTFYVQQDPDLPELTSSNLAWDGVGLGRKLLHF